MHFIEEMFSKPQPLFLREIKQNHLLGTNLNRNVS